MKTRLLKCMLTALLLITFTPYAHAELPAEAQDAMNKGVAAAEQQDYPLAITYFEEALKIAPDASVIYYNLGLAESEIPGREMRAMAWLGAYLAAEPNTSNTKAIRDRIAMLDTKSSATISSLIRLYQDSTAKIANDPDIKNTFLWRGGSLWVKAGDIAHAKEAADAMSYVSGAFLGEIALQQVKSGDYTGAQQTADRIDDFFYKQTVELSIAAAQWEAGDVTSARAVIDRLLVSEEMSRSTADDIVTLLAKHGDYAGALKETARMQYPGTALTNIAIAQGMAGDIDGSNKTIDLIPVYPETSPKDDVAKGIAEAKERLLATEDVSASGWLKLFDPRGVDEVGVDLPTLNDKYFTDLVAYVKAIPTEGPSGFQAFMATMEPEVASDPGFALERLSENTIKMINMRASINTKLKAMTVK